MEENYQKQMEDREIINSFLDLFGWAFKGIFSFLFFIEVKSRPKYIVSEILNAHKEEVNELQDSI